MKTCFAILFALLTIALNAQESLNKISVNPIQLIGYNRLNLEFERGFNNGKLGVSFYIGRTGNSTREVHGQLSWLSEENISVRYYTRRSDQRSLWFGGLLSVSSGDIYDKNGVDKALNIGSLGIMATGGYQFFVQSFYLTPYLGVGHVITNDLFGTAEYYGNIGRPTGWLLTYGIKTGIVF
jgi:hypothetical protein